MIKVLLLLVCIQVTFTSSSFTAHPDSTAPQEVIALVEKSINRYVKDLRSVTLQINILANDALPKFLELSVQSIGVPVENRHYILSVSSYLTQDHIRLSERQFKGAILRELAELQYWETLNSDELQALLDLDQENTIVHQQAIDEQTLALGLREGREGKRTSDVSEWLSEFRLWQYKALLLNEEHLNATIEGYLTPRSINRWVRHNEPQGNESENSSNSEDSEGSD